MLKKLSKGFMIFIRLIVSPVVYPIIKLNYMISQKKKKNVKADYFSISPVTIVRASVGKEVFDFYLAFNLPKEQVTEELIILSRHQVEKNGRGSTPNDAFNDLIKKLNS